jgi:hypothetical protein
MVFTTAAIATLGALAVFCAAVLPHVESWRGRLVCAAVIVLVGTAPLCVLGVLKVTAAAKFAAWGGLLVEVAAAAIVIGALAMDLDGQTSGRPNGPLKRLGQAFCTLLITGFVLLPCIKVLFLMKGV